VTNDEVRHRTNQPPVISTITARLLHLFELLPMPTTWSMLTHPKTIHMPLWQPSTLQPSGVAKPVDEGGLACAQSNWTSPTATLASLLRGNVCKTKVNDRKSWRQLCSLKGMPPDDDDWYSAFLHL